MYYESAVAASGLLRKPSAEDNISRLDNDAAAFRSADAAQSRLDEIENRSAACAVSFQTISLIIPNAFMAARNMAGAYLSPHSNNCAGQAAFE